MILSDEDYLDVHDWITASINVLNDWGINVEFCTDMEEWADFQENLPKGFDPLGSSKIFNPKFHNLSGTAFWTKCTARGEIVATHCMRSFEVKRDFIEEWVKSHNLFHSEPPVLKDWYPIDVRAEHRIPAGTITIGGGSWISPEFRGRNGSRISKMSGISTTLGRAVSLRRFHPDQHIGLTQEYDDQRKNDGMHSWCVNVLGFEGGQTELLLGDRAPYPARNKPMNVRWWWLTPEQVLEKAKLPERELLRSVG